MGQRRWAGIALALAIVGGAARADAQPSGGVSLVSGDPLTAFRVSTSRATSGVVDVDGPGFSRAFHVDVTSPGETWDVELGARLGRAVARGEVAFIRFHARAVRGADDSGDAYFTVYAQKASANWDKSLIEAVAVGPDWQTFQLPFAWGAAYAASQASFVFGLGGQSQAVQIGGVQVIGFGPGVGLDQLPPAEFSYGGRAAEDPWRAEAAARIEAIRKGDLVIEVFDDREDEAIADVDVRVEQRGHAFPFGSALQASRLTARAAPEGQPDDNAAYRSIVERLFNAGSLENDTKWPPWEGDWGAGFNQPQTLAALDWMRDRGLQIRGHVLVWPGWSNLPASITRLRGTADAARIPARVLEHIDDVTGRTAPYMREWDVVNEPYANHDLMDLFGDGIMVDWFVRARERLPEAGLVLNDYDIVERHGAQRAHQDHFEGTARFLIEHGAPITGLGIQGHFGASPTSIATVQRLLDRYAAIGLPIRITEFDVNTADEALQADYTRDFLTLIFSHPAVNGFQLWGFWEGAHWLPRGAMYRRDWSEKPNGEVFRVLTQEIWRTNVSGRTDDDGRFATRAFYGRYEVTVSWRGRTRTLAVDHARRDGPTVVRVEF